MMTERNILVTIGIDDGVPVNEQLVGGDSDEDENFLLETKEKLFHELSPEQQNFAIGMLFADIIETGVAEFKWRHYELPTM